MGLCPMAAGEAKRGAFELIICHQAGQVLGSREAQRHRCGVGKHSLRCEKAEAAIPWLLDPQLLLENHTEKSGTKCWGSIEEACTLDLLAGSLSGLFTGSHLARIFIQLRITCLGMALPTVDWALLQQLAQRRWEAVRQPCKGGEGRDSLSMDRGPPDTAVADGDPADLLTHQALLFRKIPDSAGTLWRQAAQKTQRRSLGRRRARQDLSILWLWLLGHGQASAAFSHCRRERCSFMEGDL